MRMRLTKPADNLGLLCALRPLSPRPVIIGVTANANPRCRMTCLEAEADNFFAKCRPLNEIESVSLLFGRRPA